MHPLPAIARLKQVAGGTMYRANASAMLTQGFWDQGPPPFPQDTNPRRLGERLRRYIFSNISRRGTLLFSKEDANQHGWAVIMTRGQCHSE